MFHPKDAKDKTSNLRLSGPGILYARKSMEMSPGTLSDKGQVSLESQDGGRVEGQNIHYVVSVLSCSWERIQFLIVHDF